MQTRLKELELKRVRKDYPQVNYIDKKGVQWIEINRGCKRQCPFCHADPNYKVFDIPKIESNTVQIIGEGFLYDPQIKKKIMQLGKVKINKKVVYYGLNQGIDFRLLDDETAELLCKNRFGLINNKGKWYKGIKFAWDYGKAFEELTKDTIDLLIKVGYRREKIQVFVLVNWKITFEECLYKFQRLKEWGVKIDDCTWESTKTNFIPLHWKEAEYRKFRKKVRKHNQLINFNDYDPETSGEISSELLLSVVPPSGEPR